MHGQFCFWSQTGGHIRNKLKLVECLWEALSYVINALKGNECLMVIWHGIYINKVWNQSL
jgi:hypothetical protein